MAVNYQELLHKSNVDALTYMLSNQGEALFKNEDNLLGIINIHLDNEIEAAQQLAIDLMRKLLGDKFVDINKYESFDEFIKANLDLLMEQFSGFSSLLEVFNDGSFLIELVNETIGKDTSLRELQAQAMMDKLVELYYESIGENGIDKLKDITSTRSMDDFFEIVLGELLGETYSTGYAKVGANKSGNLRGKNKLTEGFVQLGDLGGVSISVDMESMGIKGAKSVDGVMETVVSNYARLIAKHYGAKFDKVKDLIEQLGFRLDELVEPGNPANLRLNIWGSSIQEIMSGKDPNVSMDDLYWADTNVRNAVNAANNTIKNKLIKWVINADSEQHSYDQIKKFMKSYYNVINEMISIDPVLFMIGRNEQQVKGLMGEIQTGIYLNLLNSGEKFTWVGPQKFESGPNKGQQFSADWWVGELSDGFGIQVKNSASANQQIEFGNVNLMDLESTIASALSDLPGINAGSIASGTAEFVEDVMTLVKFNVEYQRKDGEAFEASNSVFAPTRAEILRLTDLVRRVMSVCSAVLLHAQTVKGSLEEVNANTLYVINGVFYTAAQMLMQIKKQVNSDKSLTGLTTSLELTSGLEKEIKETNIVDYINTHNPNEFRKKAKIQTTFNFNSI